MKPKVSFILPTIRRTFLNETIQGVLSQTLQEFELIVLDGNHVSHEYSDPRIRIIEIDKHNSAYAANIGIEAAQSDIILNTADDDIDLPNKAEETYDAITNGADIFYANFDTMSEHGRYLKTIRLSDFNFTDYILNGQCMNISTGGYNRQTCPRWRENIPGLCDYGFMIDSYNLGLKMVRKDIITYKMRMWHGQICKSNRKNDLIRAESNKILCKSLGLERLNR